MNPIQENDAPCPDCGKVQRILDMESASIERLPHLKNDLIAGTFMRQRCGDCGHDFLVERQMLYTDFAMGLVAAVFPQSERAQSALLEQTLEAALVMPLLVEPPAAVKRALGEPRRRVVFGYEELREKVVCFDAQLDDRVLEALKLSLLDGEPNLRALGVRLSLQHVDADGTLWLAPLGLPEENGDRSFLRVGRDLYDRIADAGERRLEMLLPALYAGAYVNVERCSRAEP